jgi:hypothetical protein
MTTIVINIYNVLGIKSFGNRPRSPTESYFEESEVLFGK